MEGQNDFLEISKKFFLFSFFFQAEDGIRDKGMWLEFRRVLFRSLEDSEYPIDIKEFKDYVKAIRIANIDTQYKQQFKELKKLLKKRYKIKFI